MTSNSVLRATSSPTSHSRDRCVARPPVAEREPDRSASAGSTASCADCRPYAASNPAGGGNAEGEQKRGEAGVYFVQSWNIDGIRVHEDLYSNEGQEDPKRSAE